LIFQQFADPSLLEERHHDKHHEGSEQMVQACLQPTARQRRGALRHGDYLRKKEPAGKLYGSGPEIDASGTGHLSHYHLILNHMGKSCFSIGCEFEF
jgi:hypothetical protein